MFESVLDAVVYYALLSLQFAAILALFIEIVYTALLKPSRFQIQIILMLVSTLIMLLGYVVEILSPGVSGAMVGVGIAYLGKPFAVMMALVFIADYCGKPLPSNWLVFIGIIAAIFPAVVLTNGYEGMPGHFLYYATVDFVPDSNLFSSLELTRGPLYYLYMAYLVVMFGATLIFILKEFKKCKTKEAKSQVSLLFVMIGTTIAGYVIYLAGITKGYDTTMTGASIGTICLSVLFFKYKLFDSLTLAKDRALDNSSMGLLVLNDEGNNVYSNAAIQELFDNGLSMEGLKKLEDGITDIPLGDRFYEVRKSDIIYHGRNYGKNIEIIDITVKHNYSVQLRHDVEERTKEIRDIQRSVIAGFAGIVEARDNSTGVHIKRMSKYVEIIANTLYKQGKFPDILNPNYINCLVDVAPMHDVGKLSIRDSVLLKPGKLTDEEFEIIKTHTTKGVEIIHESLDGVESEQYVQMASDVAGGHHEKWNGKGYPLGYSGDDIPLSARIAAVADVYDAVRSERCYKAPMNKEEARAVIEEGRGSHFDPTVVDAFLSAIDEIEAV